jgi:Polyketide cyclase / dehydrase and lipid transport
MARMATIIRQTMIDVAPADAWAALRDFGSVHQRLAVGFVTDCTLDPPDVRTISFFNGAVATERLVGVDEGARRLAYSVIESRLGLSHHNGAAQIIEDTEGTRFVWTTDVLPDDLAPTIAGLMDAGIAAIKFTLERREAEKEPRARASTSTSSE